MNEIPKLIVGHRVKIFYSDGFILEGKVVDGHLNLFLLTDVESSRGSGKHKEKDQVINTRCVDFVRLLPLDTGRAEPENEIPKHVIGKRVRVYFIDHFSMEAVVQAMVANIIVLHDVRTINGRGPKREKDQLINNECNRFERLEILG